MRFAAVDQVGTPVVVTFDASAWGRLQCDAVTDPISDLEQFALTGGWDGTGDSRVWRVIII